MSTSKLDELVEEFRTVVSGRRNLLDSILPPVVFLMLNVLFGFQVAVGGALVLALGLTALRLIRRQPPGYALGGLGGVALALLLGRAEGYFLRDIITAAGIALAALVSVIARRPLVAWTSHLARGWPWAWYWHAQIRPAYSEVTLAWVVFFALKALLQWGLLQRETAGFLSVVNVIMGWPATIVLLVASYLYGTWRLRNLGGPSVEEFERDAEPPWEGQQQGF
ncbi:MAG: DUF3159 domain-containing protein [Anaerolineae bacterium]|jgi:hypothetical protein